MASNPYSSLDPDIPPPPAASVSPSPTLSPPPYPAPPSYQQPYGQPQQYGQPPLYNAPPSYQQPIYNNNGQQSPYGQPVVYVSPQPRQGGGGCPKCGGYLLEDYTCCGICCGILFFPIGLICCLMMKEHKCGNCGHVIEG